ncbi:MAG: hypothetical protein SNI45_05535 [Rikenellaceae bacterium]
MNKLSKVLITVVVIFVFLLLFGVIVVAREESGHSMPGFLGLIIFAGLIGALRALWKKKNNNDNNSSTLQK